MQFTDTVAGDETESKTLKAKSMTQRTAAHFHAHQKRIFQTTDRLFIVLFTFGVLALLAAFVLPMAAQQKKINAEILAKLQQISANQQPPASAPATPNTLSRLEVRVIGGATGEARAGIRIELAGKPFPSNNADRLGESTGKLLTL